jgi:hypothetical protein
MDTQGVESSATSTSSGVLREKVKTIIALFTMAFTLLLSGCLAHMTATNAADSLNAKAQKEGNPYRWIVVDLKGDNAELRQQLAGDVGPTKVTEAKKQKILSKIEQLEAQNGRATRPQLKEVRVLTDSWLKTNIRDLMKNRVTEAWVIDNEQREFVYSVEHIPGTKDDEFLVRGPWAKR